MEKQVETELKLKLAPGSLAAFLAAPLVVDRCLPGSSRELKLVSTYYDTKTMTLQQAGLAYRVRQTGTAAFEATVKMDKGLIRDGLSERREITVPLKAAVPEVAAFTGAGFNLAAVVGKAVLGPLFTVTVTRQVKLLQVAADTVAELAIDRGEVRAGAKAAVIDEIELELKSGSLKKLLAYAVLLTEHFPMTVALQSKYEQGLKLLGYAAASADREEIPAGPALKKLAATL